MGNAYAGAARRELRRTVVLTNSIKKASTFSEWFALLRAVIVQLRSVGHVLYKKDGVRNPMLAQAVKEAHTRWKKGGGKGLNYFSFLEGERNSILKEGVSTILIEETSIALKQFKAPRILVFGVFVSAEIFLEEIIVWWDGQLSEIEDRALEYAKRGKPERKVGR